MPQPASAARASEHVELKGDAHQFGPGLALISARLGLGRRRVRQRGGPSVEHDLGAELGIRRENTGIKDKVDARFGDLRGKPFHQLDRVQAQVRRAVPPPRLERKQVPSIGYLLEPVVGERWSRAVAYQPLDACALACAESKLAVQVEAVKARTECSTALDPRHGAGQIRRERLPQLHDRASSQWAESDAL